jgi:phage terminase Nu1 subunit (DNA packaging protein)
MKDEKFKEILDSQLSLKDLPNTKLVEFMDLLSSDFDETKESIIKSTLYLDKLEELYDRVLKVYQDRNNGK